MIEEWHAKLNGGSHGHLVAFEQKILRQPHFRVRIQHAIQRGCIRHMLKIWRKDIVEPAFGFPDPLFTGESQPGLEPYPLDDAAIVIFYTASRPPQVRPHALAQRKAGQGRKYRGERPGQPSDFLESQNPGIEAVAAHHFIGSLAREHNRDVLACELRNEIQGNAGRIGHRLIKVRDHRRDRIFKIPAGYAEFMMLGAKMSRGLARIGQFVRLLGFSSRQSACLIADTERLHSFAAGDLAHDGQYRTGIQTAAEEHSKRNVRDQSQPDAFFEQVRKLFETLRRTDLARLIRYVPVLPDPRSRFIHGHPVARLQLENVFKHRARAGNVAQGEIQIERLTIQLSRHPRMLEQ